MADTIVLMNYDVIVNNRMSYSPCIELGTKDSYGLEQIKIIRGEGWTELEVLAVFHTPGGAAIKKTVGADGMLEVPPEATAGLAGQGKIVFVGLAEDKQRITADLAYSIRDHSDIDGDNPGTPTPDVVQQILENSNNAVRVAQAAKDAAENAHRAAEDAAIKAGEEAGGAADSADTANAARNAAAESAGAAAGSEANAEAAAAAAGESQAAASQSEKRAAASAAAAAKDAESIGEAAAKATQEAGTATEKASAAESARAAAESASASASASANRAEDAAKTAGDAATKVTNEGVAEKLTEMQGIQEDVKARQQDVIEKQADVTANVELARQAALSNGYMQMGVDPDTGHLMYTRTTNLKDKIDFAIVDDTNLEVQIHG